VPDFAGAEDARSGIEAPETGRLHTARLAPRTRNQGREGHEAVPSPSGHVKERLHGHAVTSFKMQVASRISDCDCAGALSTRILSLAACYLPLPPWRKKPDKTVQT